MSETNRQILRTMVRGCYDLQKLRVQIGNRICANFHAKLGREPGQPEEEMDEEASKILKELRTDYDKLMDGLKTFPREASFKGTKLISDYTELCLLAQYFDMEKQEEGHFRRLGAVLKRFPIFVEHLDTIKGIGPAMAGVIVSEIDIHKARYASSLWAYAGLDVGPDNRGRSRRENHLVPRQYINKAGDEATRQSITYNPFLKTKLMGVLATSFLRVNNETYRKIYDDYRHRMENHAVYGIQNDGKKAEDGKTIIASKGRRHQQALRYMIKRFLVDLYTKWRALEGLPVAPEYSVAKLGMVHKGGESQP